jgi:aminoglycoside phosphotransferase (APT) family kinase protein
MSTIGASAVTSPGTQAPSAEEQRTSFASWLAKKVGTAVEITEWEAPQGAGHSNMTILIEGLSASSERVPLVVRVQAAEPAVFPHYDLALQCACMQRLAAHCDLPVPRVRWLEPSTAIFGRPFYVMDRIEGLVPTDRIPYTMSGWLYEGAPEQQSALFDASIDVLAKLHAVDWRKAGLDVVDRPEYGPAGLAQQLRWWLQFARWVENGRPQPTIDGAAEWLERHVPVPTGPTVLNWGDARLSNMMFRDFRPVAVLDWEMATLGPAEVDVAFFLFFQRFFSEGLGVPDLPGFPGREEAILAYERRAGRKLDDLLFYEVFAAWRNSTIMLRIADIYEARGELWPNSGAGQNNVATRMLAGMIGLPSPGEPGGPFG